MSNCRKMTLEFFFFNFSSAHSRNLEGISFRDNYFTCYGFHDEFNIIKLFYDGHITGFQMRGVRSVS